MNNRLLPLLALLAAPLAAAAAETPAPGLPDGLYAEFTTPRGVFVAELHYRQAPLTCGAFVGFAEGTLAPRGGQPRYAGLRWYRVVPGFVIQSGNPLHPQEEGHTDFTFPDEFVPGLGHHGAGVLSMANAGPDTNSCEFFVTLADTSRLNYLHSVFGRTVRGADVLPRIQPDDAFTVRILRVGAEAKAFAADAAALKQRQAKTPVYSGAPEPGPKAAFDDPDQVLPASPPRARNFNFKLANFERATGGKIRARVYRRWPAEAMAPAKDGAAAKPAVAPFARRLAAELGVESAGALALYSAEADEWFLWVGDDWLDRFNPAHLKLHERKREVYQQVKAQAAVFAEQTRQARGPGQPLVPSDLAKVSVDAMLDALIRQFETKP